MQIYIDRLKEGKEQLFDEKVASSIIFDKDDPVSHPFVDVGFKAYLAGQELVVEFHTMKAQCSVACTVCNESFEMTIFLDQSRMIQPLDQIKGAIFDPKVFIREQILLEVPAYAECHEGSCPEREVLNAYVRKEHGSTT